MIDKCNCHFDEMVQPALSVSREEQSAHITCMSPPNHQEGNTMFEISVNNNKDLTLTGKKFLYYSNPLLAHIEPNSDFVIEGNVVTIKGRGFIEG